MKTLILFLLISTGVFSQKEFPKNFKYYFLSDIDSKIKASGIKEDMLKYIPPKPPKERLIKFVPRKLQFIKITLKTAVNASELANVNVDELQSGDFSNAFDAVDYINLLKYDARIKFYLNKYARLLLRAQITGKTSNDLYSAGVLMKF